METVAAASTPAAAAAASAPPSSSIPPSAASSKPRLLKAQFRAKQSAEQRDDDAASSTTIIPASAASAASVASSRPRTAVNLNAIPSSILDNAALNSSILSSLPPHYNFELHKSIHRLRQHGSRRVALQMPEGLLAYACCISDLLIAHAGVEECLLLGDVTYGACCVDDLTAKALQCDAMIHYGHSCLVPLDVTAADGFLLLYVFVSIHCDLQHLVRTLQLNFPSATQLTLASTIQFAAALQQCRPQLLQHFPSVSIPQSAPLSAGEVLGCTSPRLPDSASSPSSHPLVFVADGRFHLESILIQNPHVPAAFRYDPYSRKLTEETYDHAAMHRLRLQAIAVASRAQHWGLILGTLGRQGAPHLLQRLQRLLDGRGLRYTVFLLSEVMAAKLSLLAAGDGEDRVDCFVQLACPRLSVDWGHELSDDGRLPVLNSYEAEVALGDAQWREAYPMDYYANDGGEWSNYHERERKRQQERAKRRQQQPQRPHRGVIAYDS